jgi:uncharacterized membrane protein
VHSQDLTFLRKALAKSYETSLSTQQMRFFTRHKKDCVHQAYVQLRWNTLTGGGGGGGGVGAGGGQTVTHKKLNG